MRRELLAPIALAVGVALIGASCSSDDSGESSASSAPNTSPPATEPVAVEPPGTEPASTEPPPKEPTATEPPATEPPATTVPAPQAFGRLNYFGDCPALLDHLQTLALDRVTPWGLDENYYGYGAEAEEARAAGDDGIADFDAPAETSVASTPDFSGTNTQEVDVDEGDIVETDGTYVYVTDNDQLRIVSVAEAEVVAETELPEGNQQLILDGTRLLAISATWAGAPDTVASSFDVTDPTNPILLDRTHLEGNLLASRSADGTARLVMASPLQQRLPFVQPTQFGLDEEAALDANQQIIEESTIQDWLPRQFEEDEDGNFGPLRPALDCADVAAPQDFSGLGITWIASVEMDGPAEPVGSAGIVSTGDTIYASSDNLYIATRDQGIEPRPLVVEEQTSDTPPEEDSPGVPPTVIHQFSLDNDVSYVASGEVEGRLLNQFSMSEHKGDLRVATTSEGWEFGDRSESAVWVLRPNGDELEVISSVEGLGRDEQIYAVRFIGDVGYVVTFRQIDPLYVIDLSDPENPVQQGELKIPGYSAYLHPVDEGLLLGVGQDATEEGRPLGTQLSLFDVSNPRDPQRIDSLPVGGWSDVEWDHKAFLYWAPDGSIVLPVSPGWNDCPADGPCLAGELTETKGGVVVAELDGRSLRPRGAISGLGGGGDGGCWNPLLRSIAIEDELVTIGADHLQISDRQTLETRDAVQWGDPEEYGCWWWEE